MKSSFLIILGLIAFVDCLHFTLYQEKPRPFRFEGELDHGVVIRNLFKIANADVEIVNLKGKAFKEKKAESLFGELPIVDVILDDESTLHLPYYKTAEREIAKLLGLFPFEGEQLSRAEEALEVFDTLIALYLHGDSFSNGHKKWVFQENFLRDWANTAGSQLYGFLDPLKPYFFGRNSISLVDIKFYFFLDTLKELDAVTFFSRRNNQIREIYESVGARLSSIDKINE